MTETRVTIPEWVIIETAELTDVTLIGRVVAAWHNTIKVEFARPGSDNPLLGQYTLLKHAIREPELADWLQHAMRFGDL